jgi:peptidoglycan-associated lipoprotein
MNTRGLIAHAVIVTLMLVGCAKTPATTATSAPPPTGSANSAADRTGGGMTRASSTMPGGPAASGVRAVPGDFKTTPELTDIHFDFDKYDIRTADAKILDADAGWLKQNADRFLLIEGHCDERGTSEYNVALGERRAKATMNYLVSRGIAASRITIVSYGEERPVCAEHQESCWAKNRRAHFLTKRG